MSTSQIRAMSFVLVLAAAVVTFGGTAGLPFMPAGPRTLVLVQEAQDQSPAMGRLITDLRDGEPAKYFEEMGHTLLILDEEQKDEHGNPAPDLVKFQPALQGLKLPVFIVASGSKVLHRQSIPPGSTTGAQVVEIVKANGG